MTDNRFTPVMVRVSLVAAMLLLAGCGSPSSTPQPGNTTAKETGYIKRVLALPQGQRDGVLFRAIQSGGGQACQGIKQVDDMPPARPGQPTWRVICTDGSPWRVVLADDGTAYVTGVRP